MITQIDLKAALLSKLKTVFSDADYDYYSGTDVFESYKRPSFFTWLELNNFEAVNQRMSKSSYDYIIDYFQPEQDEIDLMIKTTKIQELFVLGFYCKNRHIMIDNFDFNFIGKNNNVAEITVTFSFYDAIAQSEEPDLIDGVDVTIN